MLESLLQLDRAISIVINHFHSASLDQLMIVISEKLTWVPLYIGLLLLFIKRFKWQYALVILVVVVLNLVLTDQVSVLFKNSFLRLRPCHAPGVLEHLHLPAGCGGKFGFVSSHACNTMGMALLVGMIMRMRWLSVTLFIWALLNGYSRIYLGKHYLADVIGGFLLATLIALVVFGLLKVLSKRFQPKLAAFL